MRIVSLLPSATESLCAIGGESLLVGRSHECDWPASVAHLPIVTHTQILTADQSPGAIDAAVRAAMASGTSLYGLDVPALTALAPDLILTQDLCHVCSVDVATVRKIALALPSRPAVVSCDATTVEGVLDDILLVGNAAGLDDRAIASVTALRERMYTLGDYVNAFTQGPSTVFLEWTDPLFIGGHWIPQLIERAGGRHLLNETVPLRQAGAGSGPIGTTLRTAGKSIVVPAEAIVACQPEYLFICPCGMKMPQAHAAAETLARQSWFGQLPAARAGNVFVIDGNAMFSRPGPRIVDAFAFLVGMLSERPEVVPGDFPYVRLPRA